MRHGPNVNNKREYTMRKIIIAAVAAATLSSTPAFAQAAGEGRVEARGGVAWANGQEEAIAGIAAGYDFDLGETAFVGVEGSADKILVGGTEVVFGATARAGVKAGENGKFYVNAGYSFNDSDAFHAGAGYQHKLGKNVYAKVEYRRFFDTVDINTAAVGVGFAF